MKKVVYWSPFLTNVATINAVINSAISLKKYSKNYSPIIIDACGEYKNYEKVIIDNNINIYSLTKFKYFRILPKNGFIKSRISFLIIFIISFIPLIIFLKKEKPNFFIAHLITALPLAINFFLNLKTKFILRISGLPKLNFIRFFFWKKFLKKIYFITCPTLFTKKYIESLNIVSSKKLILLRDPVFEICKVKQYSKEKIDLNFKYLLAIGRLTNQKNFKLLIKSFSDFDIENSNKSIKLIILGEGEERQELETLIKKLNLEKKVFLFGFKENVFKYLKNAEIFVLSSKWEDPGWVLIEAAVTNTLIIASDCPNGPREILENNSGFLFVNNSQEELKKSIIHALNLGNNEKKKIKINAKKKIKDFSFFKHFNELNKILKI